MEKYSAFRDPGTGIQPFLPLVPPIGSSPVANVLAPLGYIIAAFRILVVFLLAGIYVITVVPLNIALAPIPPLRGITAGLLTRLMSRIALVVFGAYWIQVDQISRTRSRSGQDNGAWAPNAGDIIISNWVSWMDILYLTFRLDPIFVLPVPTSLPVLEDITAAPVVTTSARRSNAGAGAVSSPSVRLVSAKIPIKGFCQVSLLDVIRASGRVPPYESIGAAESLESISKKANRPIVVFPECTTSNGRGLLRFADVLPGGLSNKIFVMCFRYDPPTLLQPSAANCIPSPLNPLPHMFIVARSFMPIPISVRLLAASDSPSRTGDMPSGHADTGFTETCATLIAQIGKLKRVGAGWEDKVAFMHFYTSKRKA